MRGPTQVLSDCPHCRVESALVELFDPSERVGVAIEGECRLCGYARELGEVVRFGQPFASADEVIEALARWAEEDGEADVHVFAVANFNGRDPDGIARAVLAGERVDTGFDVIAWLFPATQGSGRRGEDAEARPAPRFGPATRSAGGLGRAMRSADGLGGSRGPPRASPPPQEEPNEAPHTGTDARSRGAAPHTVARALASVMLADGRIRPVERRFLDEAVRRLGGAPLEERDLRVWRPTELGPVGDPAALIAAMRALALCDREADGSELRVLREFARAWQVPLPADPLPKPGAMAELGRALRRLVG